MRVFQFIRHTFGKLGYTLVSHAPTTWEKKFCMLADVKATDWRRIRKISPMAMEFLSMPDLEKLFGGLDEESMSTLRRFVAKLHLFPDGTHLYSSIPSYVLLWCGLCSQTEMDEAVEHEKELETLKTRYHLQKPEVSSLIHHHGLRYLPEKILAWIRDTVFVDAGAFVGDSTLVFLKYSPRMVWAFEPSPPNQAAFRETMRLNGVEEDLVRLFPQGLSDKPATIHFSAQARSDCSLTGKGRCTAELVPLDSLTPPTRIGLIKADLEGMGMSMLRGALQTIKRDKPVLALSIYHNADKFLNTYPFLCSLGLDYEYKILSLCPPWENHELTLLGWPRNPS